MCKSPVSRHDIRFLRLLTRSSVSRPSRDCKGAFLTVTLRAPFLPVRPLALALLAIWIVLSPRALAQDVPLVNVPLDQKSKEAVEVEVVEIHRLMAIPDHIERSPGKFILMVVNRTPDPSAYFVLEPAGEATDAKQGVKPLLRLGGADARKSKTAGLIDMSIGTFELKSADTGKVFCTIAIK